MIAVTCNRHESSKRKNNQILSQRDFFESILRQFKLVKVSELNVFMFILDEMLARCHSCMKTTTFVPCILPRPMKNLLDVIAHVGCHSRFLWNYLN